jgi:hypothetical protein
VSRSKWNEKTRYTFDRRGGHAGRDVDPDRELDYQVSDHSEQCRISHPLVEANLGRYVG